MYACVYVYVSTRTHRPYPVEAAAHRRREEGVGQKRCCLLCSPSSFQE